MKDLRFPHWMFAGLIALLLHGGLLAAIPKDRSSGAVSTGSGGVEMSFGPAGGAAGGTPVAPSPVEEQKPTEVETAEPPAETVQEVVEPVVDPPLDPVQEAVVEPVPEPEQVPEPAVVEQVAEVTEPVAEPVERVSEVTPPPVVEAVPEKVIAQTPPPKPKLKPVPPKQVVARTVTPPAPVRPEKPAEQKVVKPTQAPAQAAGSAGAAGSGQSTASGSSQSASSGGRVGAQQDYFSRLLAWLEKHKEYPARERRLRKQGVVRIAFTLHRNGSVSGATITQRSGHPGLDRAALKMLKKASPLPAVPADIPDHKLDLVVPVEFSLVR